MSPTPREVNTVPNTRPSQPVNQTAPSRYHMTEIRAPPRLENEDRDMTSALESSTEGATGGVPPSSHDNSATSASTSLSGSISSHSEIGTVNNPFQYIYGQNGEVELPRIYSELSETQAPHSELEQPVIQRTSVLEVSIDSSDLESQQNLPRQDRDFHVVDTTCNSRNLNENAAQLFSSNKAEQISIDKTAGNSSESEMNETLPRQKKVKETACPETGHMCTCTSKSDSKETPLFLNKNKETTNNSDRSFESDPTFDTQNDKDKCQHSSMKVIDSKKNTKEGILQESSDRAVGGVVSAVQDETSKSPSCQDTSTKYIDAAENSEEHENEDKVSR